MISINRDEWFENVFATVLRQSDLIRQPLETYPTLSNKEKDQLRQTQVFSNETIQLLGEYESFSLVRKYENTLGWIPSENLKKSDRKSFELPVPIKQTPYEFLAEWKATIYEFGGLSKEGIDCSGFTQLYFLNVHQMVLPKNSKDQRKLGIPSNLNDPKDHDLIFCRPISEPESHHVVLYFSKQCWHSRREGGVVCQSIEEFLKEFNVEDVRTIKL